jgi:F-type H+-transporting ATPase subunit b
MRQTLSRWWLLMGGWLVLASPALAAEHAEGPTNPLRLEADLGIWAIVVFVVLLLILWRFAWGPLIEGLQKREEMIRGSVDEAKKTREDMERLRLQFKKEMDAAQAQIPALMDQARAIAQRMIEEMRTRTNEEIHAEKDRARRELEVARDQALQELWNQAAQLATLISAKAIGRSLSVDDHRRLVDESVREIADSVSAN